MFAPDEWILCQSRQDGNASNFEMGVGEGIAFVDIPVLISHDAIMEICALYCQQLFRTTHTTTGQ